MIHIRKGYYAINTFNYEGINPEYLNIDENELIRYLEEHPMPEDSAYTRDDLVNDLTVSSGLYTLPDGIKQETIDYIEELLNELV